MYGGKVIDVSDLPASNFNSPLKLNVELTSDWDNYNISWYNRLQWWGARNQAVRHDNEVIRDPQYGELRVYQKEHFASKFTGYPRELETGVCLRRVCLAGSE